MERKDFLRTGIAALGLASVVPLACSKSNVITPTTTTGTTGTTGTSGSCTVSPTETQGPFPTKTPSV